MSSFARLQHLARSASRDPDAALDEVLALACELLAMDLAVLGPVGGDLRTVERAVRADGSRDPAREVDLPSASTCCAHVGPSEALLVPDVAADPRVGHVHAATGGAVGSYAGTRLDVPLGGRAGDGVVLGLGRAAAHDRLGPWEAAVLQGLAPVVAELYAAVRARGRPDAPGGPRGEVVPAAGTRADDLAVLTRPLLAALQEMSGLPTTFLCRVDTAADTQEVLLAHRTGQGPDVAEGSSSAWTGSMCNLAGAQGVDAVTDASERWPDSRVGVDLGLVTHATVPVELSDGTLWGTLCASDVVVHDDVADHVPTLRVFARLIAAEVERAAALAAERAAAAAAVARAERDELTGASTRGTVRPWLAAALASLGAGDRVVLVFIDVDRFKAVNDVHGHAAGDAVLVELVARLHAAARSCDLVARLGGDELVAAATLPRDGLPIFEDRVAAACRFDLALDVGGPVAVRCSLGFVTSDEAGADDLVAVADARMYRHKARRARTGGVPAPA